MVLAPAALRTVSPAQIALAWPFGETSNEWPYSPSHLGGLRVNLVANRVSQRSVVGFFVYAQPSCPEAVLNAKKLPILMTSPLGATGGVLGCAGEPAFPSPPLLCTGGTLPVLVPACEPVVPPPADFFELDPQPARTSTSTTIAATRRIMAGSCNRRRGGRTTLQVATSGGANDPEGREVGAGVARGAHAGAVRGAQAAGHGAAVHGPVCVLEGEARLQVCRVRGGAVQLGHQVRLGDRLAQLLRAHGRGRSGAAARPQPRDGPHRGGLRHVRRAPGTRLRRRPGSHGPALLHQLLLAGARP